MYLIFHGKTNWGRNDVEHQVVLAVVRNWCPNDLKRSRKCRAELVTGPKQRATDLNVDVKSQVLSNINL